MGVYSLLQCIINVLYIPHSNHSVEATSCHVSFLSSLHPVCPATSQISSCGPYKPNNRHILFFPLLNNLYSHRKIQPNVPRMLLKCKPHWETPSEGGKGGSAAAVATELTSNPNASIKGENELFVVNMRVNLLLGSHRGAVAVYNMLHVCYCMFQIDGSYRVRQRS